MQQLLDLIARMRGADLYVFIVLAIAHQTGADTVSPEWIRARTTYRQNMIADSLHKLNAWGLAEAVTRYAWRLTAHARQLSLPLAELSTGLSTGPTLTLKDSESPGSSSSLKEGPQLTITTTTTSPTLKDSESPAVEVLINALTATGADRPRSAEAISQALARGEALETIAQRIVNGKRYRASPAGRTIRSPYWLVAAIADGRGIPDVPPSPMSDEERYDGYRPYLSRPDDDDDPGEIFADDGEKT
ncbi:MAG TPA: hypothetical protein VI793_17205 [Anaerolineales bacterium]|nr:hypothetical protein [Anaerolineales bacterium]